jgi:hypothetical protein
MLIHQVTLPLQVLRDVRLHKPKVHTLDNPDITDDREARDSENEEGAQNYERNRQ